MAIFEYNSERGPKIYCHLISAPESRLFHEKHIVVTRHPADILREELQNISRKFKALHENSQTAMQCEESAEKIRNFITGIDELYEQLQVIIKCFTPPSQFEAKGRLDDALRAANRRIWEIFYGRTKDIHEPMRIAANALKHAGAKLIFINVINHRKTAVKGFYISRIIGENDQRGPDPKIHRKYRGKINTAFSLNHFLSSSAGRIHCYLDALDKSLFQKQDPLSTSPLPPLDAITSLASILSPDFFPDEFLKPYSKVKISGNINAVEFPFRYSRRAGENPDSIFSVTSQVEINSRTSTANYLLPYLQLTRPELNIGLDKSPWG